MVGLESLEPWPRHEPGKPSTLWWANLGSRQVPDCHGLQVDVHLYLVRLFLHPTRWRKSRRPTVGNWFDSFICGRMLLFYHFVPCAETSEWAHRELSDARLSKTQRFLSPLVVGLHIGSFPLSDLRRTLYLFIFSGVGILPTNKECLAVLLFYLHLEDMVGPWLVPHGTYGPRSFERWWHSHPSPSRLSSHHCPCQYWWRGECQSGTRQGTL